MKNCEFHVFQPNAGKIAYRAPERYNAATFAETATARQSSLAIGGRPTVRRLAPAGQTVSS
ncbi:MAG: hypothetical protein AAF961_16235 [Planctomycetota bacterium]